jgi:hypothetical protein
MDRRQVAFELLNEELAKEGLNLALICVGGFVLEHYGFRSTQDVDAFYRETPIIKEIIYRVGEQLGLNTSEELWLNNSVANLNPLPPIEYCEVLYSFETLTVYVVSLDYILGMKLTSTREQDLKDVGEIIKYKGLRSPFELYDYLNQLGFAPLDFAYVLEGFNLAYGMDWLRDFFEQNQEELRNYY